MPSSACKTCALRSEEHTSELQSHDNLVCRLLLEKTHTPIEPRPLARDPLRDRGCARARGRGVGGRGCFPVLVWPDGGGPGVALLFLFFLESRGPPDPTLFPPPALSRS